MKQKKQKETYKDPIYGIPHFHDPALCRIIRKHDPSYQVSKSMRQLYIKSQQRLKTVMGNKPKYIHTAFNIETLRTSPLICFPHFEEMTEFLSRWFDTCNNRKCVAKTSTQIATYNAQCKFCRGLFLLLQETARASPLSPIPLKGIYNWYLLRDSVINQSRSLDTNKENETFFVIELMNGKKLKVEKSLLDFRKILDRSIISPEEIEQIMMSIRPDEPVITDKVERKKNRRNVIIISKTSPKRPTKRSMAVIESTSPFDYDAFHQEMVKQRSAEVETAKIAKVHADRRRREISQRVGWE